MFLPNATVSSSPNIKHLEGLIIFHWVLKGEKKKKHFYSERPEIQTLWASHFLFVYWAKGVYSMSPGSTN